MTSKSATIFSAEQSGDKVKNPPDVDLISTTLELLANSQESSNQTAECYNVTNEAPDTLIPPIDRQAKYPNLVKPISRGEIRNPAGRNGLDHRKKREAMTATASSVMSKALKVLMRQLDSNDERIAQSAAKELLDRGFGKAVQSVANTDSDGNDVPPPPPMVVIGVQGRP